jgi:CO/xanthine dehydrogenase FAD-binding subunit
LREVIFHYPANIDEASRLLQDCENTLPIAGGTDLAILMDKKVIRPNGLVDLTNLGLNYINLEQGYIHIGPATTFSEILDSEIIRSYLPAFYAAVEQIGSVQCRSMATIGGNLCSAVPSADSVPPLLVANATVLIAGLKRERTVALEDFFIGPRKTVLERGELLTEIRIPIPIKNTKAVFIKYGRRNALTISTVNLAVSLRLNSLKKILMARIAFGAVAPTPIRSTTAEAFLIGRVLDDFVIERAASIAMGEIRPITDQRASKEYRMELSEVLLRRALKQIRDQYNEVEE